jgi:SecD/SecF fusion protein
MAHTGTAKLGARGLAAVMACLLAVGCSGDDDDAAGPTDEDQVDPDAGPGLEGLATGPTVDVVLAPTSDASGDELEAAAEVIERRAGLLGEAEVGVDDGRIGVEITGVDDEPDLDALGDALTRRGDLEFRPVLGTLPAAEGGGDSDLLPGRADDLLYSLGPSIGTGEMVESAESLLPGPAWVVALVLDEGPEGIERFNGTAAECSALASTCPTGQLAFALDGEVVSAPTLAEPSYRRDQLQISGDFTEDETRELALVLGGGPLALDLEVEDIGTSG